MGITNKEDATMICVTSLVAQSTGEGVVQFVWGDKHAQLSCDEAREHARGILECAEAAETDAFLVEFFVKIGASRDYAVRMLTEFRSFREVSIKERQH